MDNSTKESQRASLEIAVSNHIRLGAEAVFSGVFSGPSPNSLSFHHLLNRVMVVAQVPVTFIIFSTDSEPLREVYRSNNHPRHRAELDAVSEEAALRMDLMIPLWDEVGKYKLLVIKADDYQFLPLIRQKQIPENPNAWDLAAYKIEKLLDGNQYKAYGPKFRSFFFRSIEKVDRGKTDRKVSKRLFAVPGSDFIKEHFDTTMLKHDTRWRVLGRGVVDRIYTKLEKNILSISNPDNSNGRLTNFVLFARDYSNVDEGWLRYGCYDYRLRLMLGSRQKEEIRRHLREWSRGGERYWREERFLQQVDRIADKGAAGMLAREVSDEFWRLLLSGDHGIDRLVDNLGDYFSKNSRSIADPVFDGVSFFRAPFAKDAGMGRCFDPGAGRVIPDSFGDVLDQDTINDLLRIVTCQYIFESMATHSEDRDGFLQIMLNPIEVGGRVWGVVGYVTRSRSPDVKFSDAPDGHEYVSSYNAYWLQNYHIYQDVNERMKKNLRTYMNRFYEAAVAKAYAGVLRKLLSKADSEPGVDEDPVAREKEVCRELSQRFEALSCYFPYDVVKGEIRMSPLHKLVVPDSGRGVLGDGEPMESARTALFALGWGFLVDTEAASCFPDAPGGRSGGFVDAVDVAVAMTEELLHSAYQDVSRLIDKASQDTERVIGEAKNSRGRS